MLQLCRFEARCICGGAAIVVAPLHNFCLAWEPPRHTVAGLTHFNVWFPLFCSGCIGTWAVDVLRECLVTVILINSRFFCRRWCPGIVCMRVNVFIPCCCCMHSSPTAPKQQAPTHISTHPH